MIIWIILVLNMCTLSYAPEGENKDQSENHGGITDPEKSVNEESKTPVRYYPFIMIEIEDECPDLPTAMEVNNGKMVFKRDSNSNVVFLCPKENPQNIRNDLRKAFNEHNCLHEMECDKSELKVCTREVNPYLVVPTKINPSPCGPWNNGNFFGFGYRICSHAKDCLASRVRARTPFVTLSNVMYNFCYNTYSSSVIYTRHKILSPSILSNIENMKDLAEYELKEISTDPYGYDTFINKDVFKSLEAYIKKLKLVPHMMVPAKDMAFGIWKKPLYHYANVIGMSQEVHSVWNFIDERIRQVAMKIDSEFEIYMREASIEKEKFWCKIIYDKRYGRSVAIIVRSIPKVAPSVELKLVSGCIRCTFENWDGFHAVEENLKKTYCCPVKENILGLFGLNHLGNGSEEYSKYLNLDELNNNVGMEPKLEHEPENEDIVAGTRNEKKSVRFSGTAV